VGTSGVLKIDDFVDELGQTVGQALLVPTRIYARAVRKVLSYYKVKQVVHGMAHITGGGLEENLSRILPAGGRGVIEHDRWPRPPVFDWLARLGDVDEAEMQRVFNMGVGFTLIVRPFYADSIRHQLTDCGLESWEIGRIENA
jgi:phosphoribosylformylglycinamidine cyclo-ligase